MIRLNGVQFSNFFYFSAMWYSDMKEYENDEGKTEPPHMRLRNKKGKSTRKTDDGTHLIHLSLFRK